MVGGKVRYFNMPSFCSHPSAVAQLELQVRRDTRVGERVALNVAFVGTETVQRLPHENFRGVVDRWVAACLSFGVARTQHVPLRWGHRS